jgi:hypothetical protein
MAVVLQAHSAGNVGTSGKTDDPASQSADWTTDKDAGDSAPGAVNKTLLRMSADRRPQNHANAQENRQHLRHESPPLSARARHEQNDGRAVVLTFEKA